MASNITILAYNSNNGKEGILTDQAIKFLSNIQHRFNPQRLRLLEERTRRQKEIKQGVLPRFLDETTKIRSDLSWKVALPPPDLQRRWVEITGPTDSKMMINALNSGADLYMADFEDSNAPTWKNMIEGQQNLIQAVARNLSYKSAEGKNYQLNPHTATLAVRPRGLHLEEKHFLIDKQPIAASFFDFGVSFFHNAQMLLRKGSGPYYYLPKLESHLEARLWNEIFVFAQEELGLPQGSIRATVLIETILAAFEMEEILYELREHISGLNAGRWDYIFSIIKKFSSDENFLFPDRAQITMEAPFLKAYTNLLVHTCHKRGAHAIGGMSAFIPNRKNPTLNERALEKVREDKLREISEGFDGTWVAHPDLVPIAREIFEMAAKERKQNPFTSTHKENREQEKLLNFNIVNGAITEAGFRQNVTVALQYLTFWLSGTGAVALFNLMEDAATAEISRAQLWQWVHHPEALFNDGRKITAAVYTKIADEEMEKIHNSGAKESESKLKEARILLDRLVLSKEFPEFLTTLAYEKI
jgi:malate synthase